MTEQELMQHKLETLFNLTLIVLSVAEALEAVVQSEEIAVQDMTIAMQNKDTGEIEELVTTPTQVIAWAKQQLGISMEAKYD